MCCKHEQWRYIDFIDVYSDVYGYEYTIFIRKCIACGKKKCFKTRNPDYFFKLLAEKINNKNRKG